MNTDELILKGLAEIDAKKDELDECARYLLYHPEIGYKEFQSVEYLTALLEKEGFAVEKNVANIQTAFKASYGHGKPVMGVLCEYDALSGLSQKPDIAVKEPMEGETLGHGCGHNLLGTAALAAALAMKKHLEDTKCEGTVILFGTPAEEGGSGKSFMARDGAFRDLDYAVGYHPTSGNSIDNNASLANYQILYKFDGVASHAGGSPHTGRSALDALELMNVGVQFLREHVEDDARIHYAIRDAGGISPNVVQPHAEAVYLIRHTSNALVKELYERVNNIAKGAALMTGTKESHIFIKACSSKVLNQTMRRVGEKWGKLLEVPKPSPEDIAFGDQIGETLSVVPPKGEPFDTKFYADIPFTVAHGSTDLSDVSWVCPTIQVYTATWVRKTPGHSWQAVAQGQRPHTLDMMRYAGKIMAATALDILMHPEILEEMKKEHREAVGPGGYVPPIPKDVVPRALADIK